MNPSFSGEKVTPENQFKPSARASTRLSTTHRSRYRSDFSGKLRFDFSSRAEAPATLPKRAAVHCGRREAASALDEGWNKRPGKPAAASGGWRETEKREVKLPSSGTSGAAAGAASTLVTCDPRAQNPGRITESTKAPAGSDCRHLFFHRETEELETAKTSWRKIPKPAKTGCQEGEQVATLQFGH